MVRKGKGILDPGERAQFDGVQEHQVHTREKDAEAFAPAGGRTERPRIERDRDRMGRGSLDGDFLHVGRDPAVLLQGECYTRVPPAP